MVKPWGMSLIDIDCLLDDCLEICHILSHFWTKGFKEVVECRGETFCVCLHSLNNFPCSFKKKLESLGVPTFFLRKMVGN